MKTRAERLKQARTRVNLTQVEAAKRLAKAVSTIKGWESNQGTEPATLDDVARVCKLYNITIDYYVHGAAACDATSGDTQQRLLDSWGQLSSASQEAFVHTLEQITDDLNK